MTKKVRLLICLSGGLFLFLDRIFKYQSIHAWSNKNLYNAFFGWFPSINKGIAFGLPIPIFLLIIFSLFLIIIVIILLLKEKNYLLQIGLFFILIGALSNFFDRLVWQYTFDYFLIITSIFNLADVLIISGTLVLITQYKKFI